MKTKAAPAENWRQKTAELVKGQAKVWENIGIGLLSFLMSNAYIMGNMAPFGVSLAAAARRDLAMAAGAGAMAGYLFSFQPASNSRYIVSLLLLMAFKWVFGGGRLQKYRAFTVPAAAFAALLAPALLLQSIWGITAYDLIMALSEAVLCGGASFFFMRTASVVMRGEPMSALSTADLSCAIITFALTVVALGSFTVGDVSVGRAVAVTMVLLAARYGKEGGGAIAGVTAGVAMGMLGGDIAFLTESYGLGGLLAGMFSVFGSFGCAVAFVLVNGLSALVLGTEYQAYAVLYEVLIGSVAFMLLPGRLLGRIRFFSQAKPESTAPAVRGLLLRRLSFASRALEDISEATAEVSRRLSEAGGGSVEEVYAAAVEETCRKCPRRALCWERDYSGSMDALNRLTGSLREKGEAKSEELTGALKERCRRAEELVGAVNRRYRDYESRRELRRRTAGVRGVVTDQFKGLAMLLADLSAEMGEISEPDGRSGLKIRKFFTEGGAEPEAVSCYEDREGRLTAEVILPDYKLPRVDEAAAAVELSEICGEEFGLPSVTQTEGKARLMFAPKPRYGLAFGAKQLARGGARVCGDDFELVRDGRSRAHIILSDGMGSGGRAAVDAVMTTGLLKRMLQAGFRFDAALRLLNSALLVKSEEESLSTVDIVSFDLYTGQIEFLKAGAAPSYVLRGHGVARVEAASLPAGILPEVSFEKNTINLREGDTVIMVSDGAVSAGDGWLTEMLKSSAALPVQELADEIAAAAKLRAQGLQDDDITVLACRLQDGA
ncbi:MAG: SpoIIE family protein phosphatase [Oscillospiraceae bacterium]|nr:SpoIIE family protein phosphatase [Oscillospiraceae bacterium]